MTLAEQFVFQLLYIKHVLNMENCPRALMKIKILNKQKKISGACAQKNVFHMRRGGGWGSLNYWRDTSICFKSVNTWKKLF